MPNFQYQAINDSGATVSGTLEAESADVARQIIAGRGLIPSKVKQKSDSGGFNFKEFQKRLTTVKTADVILFTKQLRTMFSAGISIVTLLDILVDQSPNPKLKDSARQISKDIKEGSNLHSAFRRHDSIFNPLYCSLLKAGESSGNLPDVLDRLIYIIEHDYKVRKQIKSALMYPIIVIVLLFLAFIFLLTFVIPQFVGMFTSSGVELPLPTRICMIMYEALNLYWPYMIGFTVVFFIGVIYYIRTEPGRLNKDKLLLRMPLFGPVVQKGAMSRFTSIFSILQASGVTVLSSIEIIRDSIGNSAIARDFDNLREKLEEGRGISGPLRKSRYFTPMVVDMIAIGEESGNLDEMLREVSQHYDYEVEHAINRMTELIGPILICGLAGVVGFFALAIYLPLVDIIKTMK